jgi:hypothetical protein
VKRLGTPKNIYFDGGSEFKGVVESYLRDITDAEKITAYGDGTNNRKIKTKMAVVEAWNGRIRKAINIKVEVEGLNTITQETLNEIADDYNAKKHRGIGVRPKDAMSDKAVPKRIMYKHNIESINLPFKIGDAVRILIQYEDMETGRKDKPRYTRDVYSIIDRNGNRFRLSDGEYYPYTRLMKSREKSNVFYVKKKSLRERLVEGEFDKIKNKSKKSESTLNERKSTRERKKVDKLDL